MRRIVLILSGAACLLAVLLWLCSWFWISILNVPLPGTNTYILAAQRGGTFTLAAHRYSPVQTGAPTYRFPLVNIPLRLDR